MLTLTERKPRLHLLLTLRSCCAEAVDKSVIVLTTPFGSLLRLVFKTITADYGTEFSSLDRSSLEIYFSLLYSAWERGTNERHNGLTRRFIPKGKPIMSFSADHIRRAETLVINLSRKILGYLLRQVFKTITADNGTEIRSLDRSGLEIYFRHPYSAWERGTNERHNGLTRRFIQKGKPN